MGGSRTDVGARGGVLGPRETRVEGGGRDGRLPLREEQSYSPMKAHATLIERSYGLLRPAVAVGPPWGGGLGVPGVRHERSGGWRRTPGERTTRGGLGAEA